MKSSTELLSPRPVPSDILIKKKKTTIKKINKIKKTQNESLAGFLKQNGK